MSDIENTMTEIALTDNNPAIESEETSFNWLTFQKMSKLSWQMAASYTFSLQMVMLVYLLSQLDDSEDNLAAITLITSLINSLTCVGVSPLFSMSIVAGSELGELQLAEKSGELEEHLQARRKHISAIFGNGLIVSAITSPLVIAGMVFSKSLLMDIFKQNSEVAQITQNFVRPYAIVIPAIMVRIAAEQVMYTFSRTKPAMIIALTNFAFSMTLGSILAFGKLGSPKLGATGILIGCILDSYLTAIGYSVYIATSPRLKQFNFFNLYQSWTPYLDQLNQMRNLSRSITFSMITETAMNFMTNTFAGVIGVEQQAAFSAIMQFSLFSLLLQIAFGQTAAQELSREIGANRFYQASHAGKMGLIATLAYITPTLTALSAYPAILSLILGNTDQEFKNTLKYLAPIMYVGCIFDAARFVILQQMRTLGDAKNSTLISSSFIGFGIFIAGVLGLHTKMGIYGVATGYTSATALASILLFTRWKQRIEPKAIEQNKQNPEQFFSVGKCFMSLFNRNVTENPASEDGVEMQTNPLRAAQA